MPPHAQPPASGRDSGRDSAQGPTQGPAGGGAADGFIDSFLPRMAAHVLAMAGVALGTLWLVDQRDADRDARLDELQTEMAQLRQERDRMQRLNQELAREVHDAGVASEIARWQLRWTEERLRRTEAELKTARLARPAASAVLAAAPTSAGPGLDLPIRKADRPLPPPPEFVPLDEQAERALEARVQRIADSGGLHADAAPDAGGDALAQADGARSASGGLDPDPFDPGLPALRPADSQLARNAAYLEWKRVVAEAVEAECGARVTNHALRCERELEAQLFPYGERAVNCVMTDNAAPDYVPVTDLDTLPTHSVPLDKGAVILCDGALAHL